MYITIDPYYPIEFYNESKEALKNNNVSFTEFINIKSPFYWYFKLESYPIMVNFDKISSSEKKWLVTKVKAFRPNEEYLLFRRSNDKGKSGIERYLLNEPLLESHNSKFSIFFNIKNIEEGISLSKEFPGKIWYFGKYYNNSLRVCLCSNPYIKNYLNKEQILLEKTIEHKEIGRFESDLNYYVFREKDYLIKFTETPYFEKGLFNKVQLQGDDRVSSNKFNI